MDRIHLAINKARKAREAKEARPPAVTVPEARGKQAEAASMAEWSALTEFTPNPRHLEDNRILSLDDDAAALPFATLRTRLLYMMRSKGWKRLAITSPGTGCGKSTVALNLALGLSRLADVRTILIDADLRRPSLARLLGVSAPCQFSEVLEGKADAAENMFRIGSNLAVATNRVAAPNSAELLQSHSATAVFNWIEADFQPTLMIFDLPPMQVGDDAIAAVGLMDCVMIVAEAERTTISEIDQCERELAGRTNVLGVVLNKCRYLEKNEGYGYYS